MFGEKPPSDQHKCHIQTVKHGGGGLMVIESIMSSSVVKHETICLTEDDDQMKDEKMKVLVHQFGPITATNL